MSPTLHALLILLVAGGVTFLIRALPFLLFGNGERVSPQLHFIGRTLPLSVIAVLIVYCLKDVSVMEGSHGLPELIALAVVSGTYLWKRNTIFSVVVGTVLYMVLVQMVF